jgi:hypothetical protein
MSQSTATFFVLEAAQESLPHHPGLAPAKGILMGLGLAAGFWAGLGYAVYLLV